MPKIPEHVTQSVFFLYESGEDASNGVNVGGTGFLVEYQDDDDVNHYYAVSNRHVVREHGFSVIRINTAQKVPDEDRIAPSPPSAQFEVFEFGPEEWETIEGGEDIAVVELVTNPNVAALSVSTQSFAHEWEFGLSSGNESFGVGDDVFMIGLFVDQPSKDRNRPVARFGNISMLPHEQFSNFIVDMHSRGGFSGSPVFVYRTFGQNLDSYIGESVRFDPNSMMNQMNKEIAASFAASMPQRLRWGQPFRINIPQTRHQNVTLQLRANTMFRFLGIHRGQFEEEWVVRDGVALPAHMKVRLGNEPDEQYVTIKGPSGMTRVIPAWNIMEVLDMPKLKEKRKQAKPRRHGA